jgi:hypothetical protein
MMVQREASMTDAVKECKMFSKPGGRDSEEDSEDKVIVPFTADASDPGPEYASRFPHGTVKDIRKGATDFRGQKVDYVFFKRSEYAIYKAGSKVMIQLADDDARANKQVADIANLLPLRDQLQYLAAGIYSPHRCYFGQIAEAIQLGLEGQADVAKKILGEAVDDAISIRQRNGRICYLRVAGYFAAGFAIPIACLTLLLTLILHLNQNELVIGLATSGAGSIGALLSIAMAIRSRTVAIDGDATANIMEAFGRILIGVISAAALYLIMTSNLKLPIQYNGQIDLWHYILLIGFAGGFLERLLPDLLQKSVGRITT